MADHTPGPWQLKPGVTGAPIVQTERREVAKVLYHMGSEDPEVIPNARLITAAPNLLAACEEFVRKVECGEARSTRSYAQMKAAIAKARGGKTGGT